MGIEQQKREEITGLLTQEIHAKGSKLGLIRRLLLSNGVFPHTIKFEDSYQYKLPLSYERNALTVLDPTGGLVRRGKNSVHLTRIQSDILECLLTRAGKPATFENLYRAAWPTVDKYDEYHSVVFRVHLSNLKKKLREITPDLPDRIISVKEYGYIWNYM